jgi:hypothetical protein
VACLKYVTCDYLSLAVLGRGSVSAPCRPAAIRTVAQAWKGTVVPLEWEGEVVIYMMYKYSVLTSQGTYYVSATKPNRLILFGETVAEVYSGTHHR